MRTVEEIFASARDVPPFSNGTEGYGWMENWCWRPCMNPAEVAWRRYEDGKRKTPPKDYPGGCPLIMCAMDEKTPVEWLDQWDGEGPYPIADRYHCIEFRGPDDGDDGGEPRPRPDPPGMDGLFPRPERAIRMLQQPRQTRELIPV
jgi:hypothetical protein